ncbi:MAG: hypothetical protein DI535_06240 [Citrobacter freundii]|nr:MAG: hypothetical protein DI535_06240 [Citrobacter freundii]
MKKLILALALISARGAEAQLPAPDSTGEIRIKFQHNIEFAGFVFFMGTMTADAAVPGAKMNNGILKKDWFRYDLSLASRYAEYIDDPDLSIAANYLEKLQAPDIFRLLMSVGNFPDAVLPKGIERDKIIGFATYNDSTEAANEATAFLSALNRFYKTISFDKYFSTSGKYYQQAMKEIRSALPASGSIAMMEQFYGKRFNTYTLMPSLTIPSGMAFGVNIKSGNGISIYNLFGPFAVPDLDTNIALGFDKPQHILELSIHEFGHSFANPVVGRLPDSLISSKRSLFNPIAGAMDDQGYPDWNSCVTEHFVRAGEVIIARKMGRTKASDELLRNYIETRKFIYLPKIIQVLEEAVSAGKTYAEAVRMAAEAL